MNLLVVASLFGACAVQQQAVQSYSAAYAAPQVLYFVGAPLRVQSLVELEKRSDGDYQEYLQFKAWKAGRLTQGQPAQEQPTQAMTEGDSPLPPSPEPRSGIQQHCALCHGTATPKGGFYLDGQPGMRPQDVTAALRQIVSGKMPKDTELTREQKNRLLVELLSLEQTQEEEQ